MWIGTRTKHRHTKLVGAVKLVYRNGNVKE